MRALSAPLFLSWEKDLFPQGMAFAVIPPVLCHGRTAFHQVRCLRAFQGSHTGGERVSKEPATSMWANGNSMGLKNKSLEACLETGMDAVEAQWQHLLPPVPVVRTNKGKWAEAIELQLLLSSSLLTSKCAKGECVQYMVLPTQFLLDTGIHVYVSEEKEERGEKNFSKSDK